MLAVWDSYLVLCVTLRYGGADTRAMDINVPVLFSLPKQAWQGWA